MQRAQLESVLCTDGLLVQEVVIWLSEQEGFSAWLPNEVLTYLNPDGEEQPYEFYQQALMRLNKGQWLAKSFQNSLFTDCSNPHLAAMFFVRHVSIPGSATAPQHKCSSEQKPLPLPVVNYATMPFLSPRMRVKSVDLGLDAPTLPGL